MSATVRIMVGDCLEQLQKLPDESIQCCVTSPPYWGLRDYGDDGQIGLESTPQDFVAAMVAVFAEVRRVLRSDGVCFVNLGDSYATNTAQRTRSQSGACERPSAAATALPATAIPPGLKPKDLCGIPWRVALALQDSGWWLRQDIIWHKPNPMPESVTDRCTKAHEYIFLLTKSARYYWDADAIAEKMLSSGDGGLYRPESAYRKVSQNGGPAATERQRNTGTRNARSVWTITTKPYSGAHFATFPPELPMRCIKAGSSKKGACPACGSPWERVVERAGQLPIEETEGETQGRRKASGQVATDTERRKKMSGAKHAAWKVANPDKQLGWQPTCDCNAGDPVPCTILDPFFGAGTTGLVAMKMGRDCIGVELNPDYAEIARKRIADEAGLFGSVEVAQ